MLASVNTQYGPPEVIKIQEIKKPVPKDSELLIKVYASTVNRTDCGFRSAEYFISRFFSGLLKPKFKVLGNEFSGEIVEVGGNVNMFKIGERVFGYDEVNFGSHAEYKVIAQSGSIVTMPDNLSYLEAAPVCEGAHYALCIIKAAKVTKGQNVLVYGATGGIGSAGVQLLKYFGAQVTAVCHSNHLDIVKSMGADQVIDYTSQDYTNTKTKYDFVFDSVGKTSFGKCKPALSAEGIYISTELGKNWENIFLALKGKLTKGKRVLFPLPTIDKSDVEFLKELVVTGKFKPLMDRVYPLHEIVDAYRYVETGQKLGNVVIQIQKQTN